MKSYIVRIYRFDGDNPEMAAGLIEDPMSESREKFATFDKMKEILKCFAAGKGKKRKGQGGIYIK